MSIGARGSCTRPTAVLSCARWPPGVTRCCFSRLPRPSPPTRPCSNPPARRRRAPGPAAGRRGRRGWWGRRRGAGGGGVGWGQYGAKTVSKMACALGGLSTLLPRVAPAPSLQGPRASQPDAFACSDQPLSRRCSAPHAPSTPPRPSPTPRAHPPLSLPAPHHPAPSFPTTPCPSPPAPPSPQR